MMNVLVYAFVFLLLFAKLHAKTLFEGDSAMHGACQAESSEELSGRALIQMHRSIEAKYSFTGVSSNQRSVSASLYSGSQPSGLGAKAPLTEDGYNSVRDMCCSDEMTTFVRRLIQREPGKDVCDEGGLAGMVL